MTPDLGLALATPPDCGADTDSIIQTSASAIQRWSSGGEGGSDVFVSRKTI